MKRFATVALGTLCFTLLQIAPAIAAGGGSALPPGDDNVLPDVVVRPPGGVAFTGSQVTVWMVVAVGLLAVGVAFLIVARRRAKTAGSS
jgi:LPXTG-motif cell wall-anchored protein